MSIRLKFKPSVLFVVAVLVISQISALTVGVSKVNADALDELYSFPGVNAGVAISGDDSVAYVSSLFAAQVHKIDVNTMQVLDSLSVGDGPREIVLDASNRWAAVQIDGRGVRGSAISIVDLSDFSVARTVAWAQGESFPMDLTFTPDGKYVVTVNRVGPFSAPSTTVSKIEVTTGAVTTISLGSEVRGMGATGLALDAAGEHAYLVHEGGYKDVLKVNLSSGDVETVVTLPEPGVGPLKERISLSSVVVDADGEYLYVASHASNGKIFRVRLSDQSVKGIPASYPRGLAMTRTGTFLYWDSNYQWPNRLVKANLHTFEEVAATSIRSDESSSTDFALAPSGQFALITYNGQIARVSLTGAEPQTINLTNPGARLLGTRRVALDAVASSGLEVSYSSSSPQVCTVSGATVELHDLGSCSVTAHQAGGYGWLAAPDTTVSFEVLPQTIDFNLAHPTVLTGAGAVELRAAASSGLPVVFSSGTESVCSVSGSTVIIRAVGTCTIIAEQPGNELWDAAVPVSRRLTVLASPPPGETGVSINDGASHSNTKQVQVNLVWPEYATHARLSNDGGFAADKTQTLEVNDAVAWSLDDSVSGLYTKVVYVRFSGPGVDEMRTYSDDIILDNTPPAITSASASGTGSAVAAVRASALAGKAKTSTYVVKVKARDRLTGVRELQVNTRKSAAKSITRSYRAKSRVKLPKANRLYLRVRDGAGNWTGWRKVRVK